MYSFLLANQKKIISSYHVFATVKHSCELAHFVEKQTQKHYFQKKETQMPCFQEKPYFQETQQPRRKMDYEAYEVIGRGRFGVVYRVFCPQTEASLACKSIDKRPLRDSTDRGCLENEVKVMTLMSRHPNIVRIYDVIESYDTLNLYLELCQRFTLYDKILRENLCESQAASYMQQLMSGLAHCHRFGIVHRDIKPHNIFFDFRDNLKIGDFGSARVGKLETADGFVGGNPYYIAPEIVMGRAYNDKVDVWSAGVILYFMLAGVPPNGETADEISEAVLRENLSFPPKIFSSVSDEAKDLLRKMICRDVSRRLSAEEVLRHRWILNGREGETTPIDKM